MRLRHNCTQFEKCSTLSSTALLYLTLSNNKFVSTVQTSARLEDALDAQPRSAARLRRALQDAEAAGLNEDSNGVADKKRLVYNTT